MPPNAEVSDAAFGSVPPFGLRSPVWPLDVRAGALASSSVRAAGLAEGDGMGRPGVAIARPVDARLELVAQRSPDDPRLMMTCRTMLFCTCER